MKLQWIKSPDSLNTYRAETVRYRYVLVAPPRANSALWVQSVTSDWGTDPIAERSCRTRRRAERMAQRFENRQNSKQLI